MCSTPCQVNRSCVRHPVRSIDRVFNTLSGQTNNCKIGICWFSSKHAALRSKSKDWLARNQNNVSEWSDMFTRGLLCQWTSTINIQLSLLVEHKAEIIIISSQYYLFSPWDSWKIAELTLKNNYSHTICDCMAFKLIFYNMLSFKLSFYLCLQGLHSYILYCIVLYCIVFAVVELFLWN